MKHPFRNTRRLALRKLRQLFAALDRAVNVGQLDQAKDLLVEVRDTLTDARHAELGAAIMRLEPTAPRGQPDPASRSRPGGPSPRSRYDQSGIRRFPEPEASVLESGQRPKRRIPG